MFYMIDSENVGISWTPLLKNMKKKDRVYFFYTNNTKLLIPKVTVAAEELCTKAKIKMVECATGIKGHSALDFQLSTYIGLLSGKKKSKDFTIVSGDNDFYPLMEFWAEHNVHVEMIDTVDRTPKNKIALSSLVNAQKGTAFTAKVREIANICNEDSYAIGIIAVNVCNLNDKNKTVDGFVDCINSITASKHPQRWQEKANTLKLYAPDIIKAVVA